MKHKAHYGEQFPLSFQLTERDLLLALPRLNPRLAERLRGARAQAGRISVTFTPDDVDELVALLTIAAREAEEGPAREALAQLCERLGKIEFVFDDPADEEP